MDTTYTYQIVEELEPVLELELLVVEVQGLLVVVELGPMVLQIVGKRRRKVELGLGLGLELELELELQLLLLLPLLLSFLVPNEMVRYLKKYSIFHQHFFQVVHAWRDHMITKK